MENPMSIAPTRRVSSSTTNPKIDRGSAVGGRNEQFVEIIDTNNNILVRDDPEHDSSNQRNPKQNNSDENKPNFISPSTAYVNNSIEALAVSGVFNEENQPDNNHKVGVYDNNQAIVKDEELDRTGHSYLKHFYEKNEHIKEVDEFI